MTTPIPTQVASVLARSLGHLPGAWRDFGEMRYARCQRCKAQMVENRSDGRGVTGEAVEKACRRE